MTSERISRVRRVRELQERIQRAEWAAAERSAQEAEDVVLRLTELRADSGAALAKRMSEGRLDPRQLSLDEETLDRLDSAVLAARALARNARHAAERERMPWQQRRTEAEALRRLELRYAALARAEAEKAEREQLDEASGARHARERVDATGEAHGHDAPRTRTRDDE